MDKYDPSLDDVMKNMVGETLVRGKVKMMTIEVRGNEVFALTTATGNDKICQLCLLSGNMTGSQDLRIPNLAALI